MLKKIISVVLVAVMVVLTVPIPTALAATETADFEGLVLSNDDQILETSSIEGFRFTTSFGQGMDFKTTSGASNSAGLVAHYVNTPISWIKFRRNDGSDFSLISLFLKNILYTSNVATTCKIEGLNDSGSVVYSMPDVSLSGTGTISFTGWGQVDSVLITATAGVNLDISSSIDDIVYETTTVSPVPYVEINNAVTVNEGGTVSITNSSLKAADNDSAASTLQYTLTTSLAHGRLENSDAPGTAITTFTQGNIDSGKIRYVHDHSDTTSDSFVFKVSDGTNELTGQTFSIKVTAVYDDPIPTGASVATFDSLSGTYTNGENIPYSMAIDGFKFKSSANLGMKYQSSGGQDNTPGLFTDNTGDIKIGGLTIKRSTACDFKLISMYLYDSGIAGSSEYTFDGYLDNTKIYTKSNINVKSPGKITFDWNSIDEIRITAVTGTAPDIAAIFDNIVYQDTSVGPVPYVETNNTVTVNEGGTVSITNSSLKAADNDSVVSTLQYTLTTSLAHGRLENSDAPGTAITTFTQGNIDSGKIRYVHDHSDTKSDSFVFKVSDGTNELTGQTFNITVTPVYDDPIPAGASAATFDGLSGTYTSGQAIEYSTVIDGFLFRSSADLGMQYFSSGGQDNTAALKTYGSTQITSLSIKRSNSSVFKLITMFLYDNGTTGSSEYSFEGYIGGSKVYTKDYVNVRTPVTVTFNWENIDEIRVIVTGTGADILAAFDNIVYKDNNAAPVASAVSISGTATYGQELTGSYTYNDAENDADTSTFKWYRANDVSGTGKAEISGATASTYALTAADVDKYICFEVTPKAAAGTSPGTAESSSYTSQVQRLDCETTTITAPVLSSKTDTSVTLTSVTGYEYLRVADGAPVTGTWQDNNVFTGLTSNTAYDFYQRVKQTATHKSSGTSAKLDVTTYATPTDISLSNASIAENTASGTAIGTLTTTDADVGDTFTYSLVSGTGSDNNASFSIVDDELRSAAVFDFETKNAYSIRVRSTDAIGAYFEKAFTITVTGVDDIAPTLVTNTGITLNEGATATINSSKLQANDADTDNNTLVYSVTSGPSHGQLELTTGPGVAISSFTQAQLNANQVIYKHDGSEINSDSFGFDVQDGSGNNLTGRTFNITTIPMNDAPVLAPASPALTGITVEDTDNSGQTVASFVGATISDDDMGAQKGIAIVSTNSGSGEWQYSTSGGAIWTAVGTVNGTSSLLLRDTDYVRYVPYGTPTTATITYRAWDRTSGSAGARVDSSTNGGTTAFSTATNTAGITVSPVPPKVTSVSPPSNGTYMTGQNLSFTVNFDKMVNVAGGTPRIALTIGSETVYANYASGTGSSSLIFRYTVETGLLDSDGITVGALSLNGATIRDADSNNAALTLNSVGSTTLVLVDAVVPTVNSVGNPTNGTYTVGQSLDFTVNFSEAVTVTGTPRIELTIGTTTVYANYASGSGTTAIVFRYTVGSGLWDGDGITVGSSVLLNGGSIKDAPGNNATLTFTGGTLPGVLVKKTQTITFTNPGAKNFGTSPTLSATSSSGLTVTFTSDTTDVCTITSGGALTFLKAGDATISADQAGNDEYLPATTVSQTFKVNAVVPGAPTIGTATAGDNEATVTFTAPSSTGGAAISGYTVTANPGGATGTGTGSPITVTGLTNGTAYTFTVTATNSAGTGLASTSSNSVTPKASQTITFADPGAQNFGTTPTLTAFSTSGLTVSFTSDTPDVCSITSGGTLTFLKAGEAKISANQAGNGSFLSATTVTRTFNVNAVAPGAPTSVTATAGDGQASISFTPPVFTGGEDITGYTVTSSPGGLTASGTSSPITVTGLTNGTIYTFTVKATNKGSLTSVASAASNSVTPVAVPTVTGLSPSSGSLAGGTSVTITGTNLTGATAVSFGSTAATSFTVDSATQITATAPAHSAGNVYVTVTTPAGTSTTGAASQYTYVPAPTVTSMSPTSGPLAGGTSVTITGTNFSGATAVSFGGTAAAGYTVNSSTQITATAPAHSAGTVDVTVTTAGGTSATSAADQFTYVPAPTVTGISPASGPLAGGTSVIITGTNFSSATAVRFGSTAATAYTVNSATQITVTAPAHSVGTVNVTVTTPGGTSVPGAADLYTYVFAPAVTDISPSSGTMAGGTSVTITGTNLTGATVVTFGSTNATAYTVNSATQITATAPAHSAGNVYVTVTTAGGTSATSAASQYTFADITAPTLSAQSASAVTSSGAMLNITSDEAGTYYYLVYAAADAAPSAAAVKAQGAAAAKGTGAVAASANAIDVTGLSGSTAYKAYVIVADAADNMSAVSTISFTTKTKLSAPTGLAWDSAVPGKAKWNMVVNASSYSVRLYKDGNAMGSAISVAAGTHDYDFTSAITMLGTGTYTFELMAKGDGISFENSNVSVRSSGYSYAAPSPTPAPTPAPTPSPTPKPTPKPTATPEPTATPTPAPTVTPAPTATPEPSSTPGESVAPTPSPSATTSETAGNTRTITGTLLDADGNPMAGYVVELHSDPVTTVTDANGRYAFYDVDYTSHDLIVKTPEGEKIAQFELAFTQGDAFGTNMTDEGVNITYTRSTATVTIDVALEADESGAAIEKVEGSDIPQKTVSLNAGNSALLWIGIGTFAALIIAVLIILLAKRKKNGEDVQY